MSAWPASPTSTVIQLIRLFFPRESTAEIACQRESHLYQLIDTEFKDPKHLCPYGMALCVRPWFAIQKTTNNHLAIAQAEVGAGDGDGDGAGDGDIFGGNDRIERKQAGREEQISRRKRKSPCFQGRLDTP